MMTCGTILTGPEKDAIIQIIHLNNLFLGRCFRIIKANPLNLNATGSFRDPYHMNSFLNFTSAAPLNYKMFQHFCSVMYSNLKFPLSVICDRFNNISVHNNDYTSNMVDMDHLIAIVAGASIKNQPPFTKGPLYVLGAPTQLRFIENSLPYQHTKQPYPDYEKITYDDSKERQVVWSRHYDLKAGKISVNRGHIYITTDATLYEEKSKALLQNQLTTYKSICDADSPLVLYLYHLVNQKNISWGDRHDLFKNFLLNHMRDLPNNINPSLIFKVEPDYDVANMKPSKKLEGIVRRDGFEDLETSQKTLAKALYEVGGKEVVDAYMHFNPFSPITKILKAITSIT